MDKNERLMLFYQLLSDAHPVSTHDEALELITVKLNSVEDEYSGVPYNPQSFLSDGRLYPPQLDNAHAVDGFPDVTRYRSTGHNTFIANNGAIEVKIVATNEVQFVKNGANGKGVWE